MVDQETEMGGQRGGFPNTRWSLVKLMAGETSAEQRMALGQLMERYWKPVYCYLIRRGYSNEESKDLVQEFFSNWFLNRQADQADPDRGKFRSFLLKSLENFLHNQHRKDQARRRQPLQGIVSIDQLASGSIPYFEPVEEDDDPEQSFIRTWMFDLMCRVMEQLRDEWSATTKEVHYELFRRWIVEPALKGGSPPSMDDLAEEFNIGKKDAQNRILTARRAFTRLLRQEIRSYATTEEEVAAEIRDLFNLL